MRLPANDIVVFEHTVYMYLLCYNGGGGGGGGGITYHAYAHACMTCNACSNPIKSYLKKKNPYLYSGDRLGTISTGHVCAFIMC